MATIELHRIVSVPPQAANTGSDAAPKSTWFGGTLRGRWSSQSLKRAALSRLGDPATQAVRSRYLPLELAARVSDQLGAQPDGLEAAIGAVFEAAGLAVKPDADGHTVTTTMILVDQEALGAMAAAILPHWAAVVDGEAEAIDTVAAALAAAIAAGRWSAQIALFGRMLEAGRSSPIGQRLMEVDAASAWAHGLTTHTISQEEDFWVAFDSLAPVNSLFPGPTGAAFHSATYYTFVSVDMRQLRANLRTGATEALAALIPAAMLATPSGRENSFYSQAPPAAVLVVVRPGQTPGWQLADAFSTPIRHTRELSVPDGSVQALWQYFCRQAAYWQAVQPLTGAVLALPGRELDLAPLVWADGETVPAGALDTRGRVTRATSGEDLVTRTLALVAQADGGAA